MKWDLKSHLFALAMIIVAGVAALYFSAILPDTVPSHYGTEGIPDQWSPKSELIILGVASPVGLFLVLTFIPRIDPFWKKLQSKYGLLLIFRDIAMGAVVYFAVIGYLSAHDGKYAANMSGLGIGLTSILVGNYLPKLPRNFFFGIRSPWTLASEEVWKRTHRISGWLFLVGGIIIAILSFFPFPQHIVLLSVLLPLVVFCGVVYPYALYRKLERGPGEHGPQL